MLPDGQVWLGRAGPGTNPTYPPEPKKENCPKRNPSTLSNETDPDGDGHILEKNGSGFVMGKCG